MLRFLREDFECEHGVSTDDGHAYVSPRAIVLKLDSVVKDDVHKLIVSTQSAFHFAVAVQAEVDPLFHESLHLWEVLRHVAFLVAALRGAMRWGCCKRLRECGSRSGFAG